METPSIKPFRDNRAADTWTLLRECVQRITDQGTPLETVVANLLAEKNIHPPSQQADLNSLLTDRQLTVLDYICRGFTSMETANLMDISYYTVTTHLKQIYRKLNVSNRAEAIFEARQLGVGLDSPTFALAAS